jgi:hypothetical protein
MRIKNITVIFLIFFSNSGFGQSKVFEYVFKETPTDLQPYFGVNEETNSQVLHLSYDNYIQRFLINNDSVRLSKTELVKEINYHWASEDDKNLYNTYKSNYIGSIANQYNIEAYYLNERNITTISTNIETGQTAIVEKIKLAKKEKFVSAFMQNNTYYFLTYFRKSNKIRIYKKIVGTVSSGITKDLELSKNMLNGTGGKIIKKTIEKFSEFFESPYTVIENNKNYPLAVSNQMFKIYIQLKQLIFSLDNQYHKTILITLDLNDLSSEFVEFEQPYNYKDKNFELGETSTNSFLIDSVILQANVINNKFNFSICNRKTGEVYNSYSAKDIIKQEIKRKKSDTSVASFNKMIKKIRSNQILVTAQSINDTMDITIGALYQKSSETFAQIALSLSLTALGTIAINSIPNTYGYSIFIFGQTNKKNTISFQSLFNKKTFSHLEGEIDNENAKEIKIKQFISQNDIPKKNTFLVQSKDHYYLGYLQKKENKFLIYSF